MNVKLYVCSDDPRQLLKQPSDELSIDNCDIYDSCSLFNPTLILDYKPAITTKNYAYIPEWNRYYFISNMNITNSKRIILRLSVDVLQTYKDQLYNQVFRVARSESNADNQIPDTSFVNTDLFDIYRLEATLPAHYCFGNQSSGSYCIVLGVNGNSNSHLNDIPSYEIVSQEPSDWNANWRYYFLNLGSVKDPEMRSIQTCIDTNVIQNWDYSDKFAGLNASYGPIYGRVNS